MRAQRAMDGITARSRPPDLPQRTPCSVASTTSRGAMWVIPRRSRQRSNASSLRSVHSSVEIPSIGEMPNIDSATGGRNGARRRPIRGVSGRQTPASRRSIRSSGGSRCSHGAARAAPRSRCCRSRSDYRAERGRTTARPAAVVRRRNVEHELARSRIPAPRTPCTEDPRSAPSPRHRS